MEKRKFEINLEELGYTEKELEEFDKLWCKCDYLEEHPGIHPEYVQRYMGVHHGWICPKCRKFVQIG